MGKKKKADSASAFNKASLAALIAEAETLLADTTDGPWRKRGGDGTSFQAFVEADEPEDRHFGYGIEITATLRAKVMLISLRVPAPLSRN